MPEDPTEELADATSLIPVYQLWIEIYIPEVEQTGYLGMGPMFQFSDTKFETILPMDLDAKDMVFKSILITKDPSYTDAEDPTLDRVVAKTIF